MFLEKNMREWNKGGGLLDHFKVKEGGGVASAAPKGVNEGKKGTTAKVSS